MASPIHTPLRKVTLNAARSKEFPGRLHPARL